MKNVIKKISGGFLILLSLFCLISPGDVNAAFYNDYVSQESLLNDSQYNWENPFEWGQCTWYAWGRMYQKTKFKLPLPLGHAMTWADSLSQYKIDEPMPNSILVLGDPNLTSYGHVMFIEDVVGDKVITTEANYDGSGSLSGINQQKFDKDIIREGNWLYNNPKFRINGIINPDTIPPTIHDAYTGPNTVTSYTIYANATDNVGVKSGSAVVTAPNGTTKNYALEYNSNSGLYSAKVNSLDLGGMNGNYKTTIYFDDRAGNVSSKELKAEYLDSRKVTTLNGYTSPISVKGKMTSVLNMSDAGRLTFETKRGTDNQKFIFEMATDYSYAIKNVKTGKYINSGFSGVTGGNNRQAFYILSTTGGYVIVPSNNINTYFNTYGANGATIVTSSNPTTFVLTNDPLTVQKVTMSAPATMFVNDKIKVSYKVEPEITGREVKYYVNDTTLATIDENGYLTAKRKGIVKVYCIYDGVTSSVASVNINENKPILAISLNYSSRSIDEGSSFNLTASYTPSDTTSDKKLTFSSSNTNICTVDSNGKVTGKKAGTCVVTVKSSNGKTKSCTVTVKSLDITNVVLVTSSKTLKVGQTYNINAYVTPINTNRDKRLTYTSTNTRVAKVDVNGKITAVGTGSSDILVRSYNGIYKVFKVKVEHTPITSISLNASSKTMNVGSTYKLKATVNPTNTTMSKSVMYTSDNTKVATVSSDGTITCKSAGAAIITATTSNGIKARVFITGKEVAISSVSLNSSLQTLYVGDTYNLKATVNPSTTTMSKTLSYKSSNTKVATVSSNGSVKCVGSGTAVITVTTVNGKTSKFTVIGKVKTISISSVRVNATNISLYPGEKFKVIAEAMPTNTTMSKVITYSSSNSNVAYVDKYGSVYGMNVGSAYIYCKSSNGRLTSVKVTVKQRTIPITKVVTPYAAYATKLLKPVNLGAYAYPTNTTMNKNLKYSVDSKYCTVLGGSVTCSRRGSYRVYITASNGVGTSVKINVA